MARKVNKANPGIERGPDTWQIEEDMRTLLRAEEVRKDPKRFKAAQKLAKDKLKEMQAVFPSVKK
ncbi:MAG: hypothetical protein V4607_02075 [Pseudomonadota bacterium]